MARTALYMITLMADAAAGRVSTYDIMAVAQANGACSRGRALASIDYGRRCGRLEVQPGDEHRTKRPLTLSDTFVDFARLRTYGR